MSILKNRMLSVHVVLSTVDPRYSSRVMKMCEGALDQGLVNEVLIYSLYDYDYLKHQSIRDDFKIIRIKLLINIIKKSRLYHMVLIRKFIAFLSIIQFRLTLFLKILKARPQFIHCHHLSVLPVCVIISRFVNAKLIYEPHELETECVGNVGSNFFKMMERIFIKYAHKVVLVCDPIRDWYVDHYKLNNAFVIRNIPAFDSIQEDKLYNNIFRTTFNIPEDHIIYIYQGILNSTRGISELMDCFKQAGNDKHIIFMGFGESVDDIIVQTKLYPNIHYHITVNSENIVKYTSAADVGICYLENYINLSYKYSLSNKFFEFLKSGIPVMFNDVMEYMALLINKNDCGWVVPTKRQELVNIIKSLTKADIAIKRNSVLLYNKQLDWDIEKQILIQILK